jgi:GGDEF domain-containing protein
MTSEGDERTAALVVRLLLLQELAAKLHADGGASRLSRAQSAVRWIFPGGRLIAVDARDVPQGTAAFGPATIEGVGRCYVSYFPGPGEPFYLALTGADLTNSQDFSIVAMFIELVSASLRTEGYARELENQARTDWLTGLANRYALMRELERGLPAAYGIGMADVNGLKEVNDSQGHASGDAFLRRLANRLSEVVGTAGQVYRWGGDEFVVVATRESMPATERILTGENDVSFGWAPVGNDPERALAAGDAAMYEGRKARRDHSA